MIRSYSGKASIGIEAPTSIKIHREEVFNRIQRECAKGERTPDPDCSMCGGTGSIEFVNIHNIHHTHSSYCECGSTKNRET